MFRTCALYVARPAALNYPQEGVNGICVLGLIGKKDRMSTSLDTRLYQTEYLIHSIPMIVLHSGLTLPSSKYVRPLPIYGPC